jgi:hypothetical protein
MLILDQSRRNALVNGGRTAMDKVTKSRISGKEATYVALAAAKYPPVRVGASEDSSQSPEATQTTPNLPAPVEGSTAADGQRKAPPRVRKPSPMHNQYLAPTADLDNHRARLREAFGNTMSDEFVEVMLGKIIEALKPNPFDQLDEATLNSALAIIDSVQCRSELEAFIAVEIVATGFAGLRFLRQSQHSMTDDYIRTYGPYANKLLRLHLDLIQAVDRHRRGHKQTVEVHHLHVHSGAQGLVGIVNAGEQEGGTEK